MVNTTQLDWMHILYCDFGNSLIDEFKTPLETLAGGFGSLQKLIYD